MDYKNLLVRYILHVIDCEGVDFITLGDPGVAKHNFTKEEFAELERITEKISNTI